MTGIVNDRDSSGLVKITSTYRFGFPSKAKIVHRPPTYGR